MPYSQEAEQSVLGAILLDSSYLNLVLEILPNSDFFYVPNNKLIYESIIDMFSLGKKIDYVTVLENLPVDSVQKNEIKNYMLDIVQIVPSISNIESYAKIIQDKFELRNLISLAREILQESTSSERTDKLLDFAEQKLIDIRSGKSNQTLVSIKEVLMETFDRLDKLNSESQTKILGIPTGFGDLDFVITGLNKSDLILIAARPAMGKTSFALNIAKHVSEKLKTAVFSLEMSKEQLASRLLSMEGKIPGNKLRRGHLDPEEWGRLTEASEAFSNSKLYIDDTAGITVNEVKAKVRRLGGVSLVLIDYLQLISSAKKISNRVQEISDITRQLKIMAKELNIPVICLSQLSRASEQRSDHRPLLSDLRDSGSIEQDADIVIMLYREGYYKPMDEKVDQNECECIIAKNRHGETRTISLHWEPEYTRFTARENFEKK
ncbi:MAG: replicative DNA helicase [Clostridia bacterium]|nr:replicative DNA helicase [Clostridia bacterium]